MQRKHYVLCPMGIFCSSWFEAIILFFNLHKTGILRPWKALLVCSPSVLLLCPLFCWDTYLVTRLKSLCFKSSIPSFPQSVFLPIAPKSACLEFIDVEIHVRQSPSNDEHNVWFKLWAGQRRFISSKKEIF